MAAMAQVNIGDGLGRKIYFFGSIAGELREGAAVFAAASPRTTGKGRRRQTLESPLTFSFLRLCGIGK
jgi:hypothetical protein